MTKLLEVTDIETGEVIHTVIVAGRSDATVERVMGGMLTNMDTDKYFVNEVD